MVNYRSNEALLGGGIGIEQVELLDFNEKINQSNEISNPNFQNITIVNNKAKLAGGGLYINLNSNLLSFGSNNQISNNSASIGGGIFVNNTFNSTVFLYLIDFLNLKLMNFF